MEFRKRYIVRVEMKPGVLSEIYSGNNRETAVDKCNFWDERVNSYFIDKMALPFQERLDLWIAEQAEIALENLNTAMQSPAINPYFEPLAFERVYV